MKALQLAELTGPQALRLVDLPDPEPGHGEVLLRIIAIALNYRDYSMSRGGYAGTVAPLVPFSDACAIVDAVGPGVTRVKPGDRVATLFHQGWIDGRPTAEKTSKALALGAPGVGRQRLVLSQEGVSKVPDYLSDHQVATLPCAALTAWRALFEDGYWEPGDTVVLEGTGGVSVFGLQFAAAAGWRTVVTSSSDQKLARAKALGATHAINYRTTPEWSQEVRRLTGGRGAELIIDVGGSETLEQALNCVAVGGRINVIGLLSGAPTAVNAWGLIRTSARLSGFSVGSRAMFESMVRAMELHRIEPVVDKVYPWDQAAEALTAMVRGEHFGKIVLDVSG